MEKKKLDNLVVENAKIIFKNFQGVGKKYNDAGTRNFCLVIEDPNDAEKLKKDGWNVKVLAPRDDTEEPTYYIPVAVSYSNFPPKVYLVNKRNHKTKLDEETIGELDSDIIKNIDLTIRPYNWEVNGNTGVKAYLRSMYVTIEEDEFAEKYAEEEFPDDDELPFNE